MYADTAIDVRSDIYSLGLCLYCMLEGRNPYSGSIPELIRAQVRDPLPALTAAGVPHKVVETLRRMTAKSRDERYQNTVELVGDLRELPGARPGQEAR